MWMNFVENGQLYQKLVELIYIVVESPCILMCMNFVETGQLYQKLVCHKLKILKKYI
jgi:hypothetical protein